MGITYSLWNYGYLGETNTLQTGDVSLKHLESTSEIIDIKNALPKGDNEGKTQEETFNFAVITKASYKTALSYDLSIEKLEVDEGYTSLEDKDIKVYLEDYNNNELLAPSLISDLNNKILYSKINKHSNTTTEITDKYKLRVWLDKEVDISNWTKETKLEYKFKIGVKSEETEAISKPNAPVLDDAMIPVYYDETSETWKKADSSNENNSWYDYDSKKWANSVTVSSANRSTYKSASVGTEIPMDDILTMQVWIPRYKYKVWNYNADGTATSDEQEIEIEFEKGTSKTGEITCTDSISGTDGDPSETCKLKATNETCTDDTCNNKTYTHPAFTFGEEEIEGFWIGKFELTGTISNITVKPNLSSLRSQKVSSFETNIMNMKNSGNRYGLSTSTDTHMIKNMEWGAVAYLSHSKYGTCSGGTCKEVNINNSEGYTGRSGGSSGASGTSEGTYKYNETKQTTTTLTGGTEITSTVTNATTYPWTSSDGLYKSSNQGQDSTTTNLKFSFTAPTDDTYLSFDWSVSSESASLDYLYYTITKDGTTLSDTGISTKIGGTTLGTTESALTYKNVSKKLDKGTYELTFTYTKDSSDASGTDTGYVKNIKVLDSPTVNEKVETIGEGKDGPSASTTGNIYGVYDISGGTAEYTMANIVSSDGTTMQSGDSGYTTSTYPDDKYYDKYSYSTSDTSIKRSKLGDGIKEVYKSDYYGWYSDLPYLAYSILPWFLRGANYSQGADAGVFYSWSSSGISAGRSSRPVITP